MFQHQSLFLCVEAILAALKALLANGELITYLSDGWTSLNWP